VLYPERYPEGGIVNLTPQIVEHLSPTAGAFLGTAVTADPFRVRIPRADEQVEEVDRSGELLTKISAEKIDAVISVVGLKALSTLWKLSVKGLKSVCIPESVENDVAGTSLSFGFNSALSCTVEMLERARQAALSARKIGIVEVLGEQAGWLALQAGIAVGADAVLIPEIPYNLQKVTARLREKARARRTYQLVVAAQGAAPASGEEPRKQEQFIREHPEPGHAAETVALLLHQLTGQETYPLVLGQLVKGGMPTAVDRQLGLGYGAAAVRALKENQSGVMVSFQPPHLKFVPLAETVKKVNTVPLDSLFVQIARSLGICLGD
jgi:6-phosphofructokinase 1